MLCCSMPRFGGASNQHLGGLAQILQQYPVEAIAWAVMARGAQSRLLVMRCSRSVFRTLRWFAGERWSGSYDNSYTAACYL